MTLKKRNLQAFTLIEMLVVLLIISILLLLFVPNLSKQKDKVKDVGSAAIVRLVETQAESYELDHDNKATLSQLVKDGQITQEQADSYKSYYKKHNDKKATVSD